MQWNSSKNAGFSKGKPWLSVNTNYKDINAENSLKDENSIFYHYKKLISMRKQYDVIAYGNYSPILDDNDYVFAYKREFMNESLVVINNYYEKEVEIQLNIKELEKYKCIISNYEERSLQSRLTLKPYESIAFIK